MPSPSSIPASNFSAWPASRCCAWVGGVRVIAGTLEIGVLVAFMMYAQRFFRPIQDLSEKFNILQSAMAASERIFKLLDEPVHDRLAGDSPRPSGSARRNRIPQRLVRLSRRRRPRKTTNGCCATFPSASSRVRRSPSSATPARAKPPSSSCCCVSTISSAAQILLDGVDIRELDLQDLRRHVRHRAAGSVPVHRHARIQREARHAERSTAQPPKARCAKSAWDHFSNRCRKVWKRRSPSAARRFPSASANSSSFARALAHDPKFLILDEATSSVDTKTELMIREALDRLLEGPHGGRDRAPPEHHSARGPHSRLPQRPPARAGLASGTARAARNLLPPLPAAVQRAGIGRFRCPPARCPGFSQPLPAND